MSVLSDKWIKKTVKSHKMISPFISKQVRKGKYHTDFPLMDMMQEFQMISKFLQMKIQQL